MTIGQLRRIVSDPRLQDDAQVYLKITIKGGRHRGRNFHPIDSWGAFVGDGAAHEQRFFVSTDAPSQNGERSDTRNRHPDTRLD